MNDIMIKLATAPFFSFGKVGTDLFQKFENLKEIIQKRGAEDFHTLNNEKVTGVWYFTRLKFEGNAPQLLIRTEYEKKSYEYLLVCSEIHEFLGQDVAFHLNDLFTENMIIGQREELASEILEGRLLTIYDKEREM